MIHSSMKPIPDGFLFDTKDYVQLGPDPKTERYRLAIRKVFAELERNGLVNFETGQIESRCSPDALMALKSLACVTAPHSK